ncbi:hypothetical protein GGR26_000453 [Lewinella marina]|uniref:Peptidase M43 pregnancy-associated plasma-A domain-containing protein n=1 Tax=Neolewinella marina TaxID=438751 RepID=A0A2G0CJH3_9BACT|nr:M43 family zinc metalloprotease [Neolewinella marina]NJB84708.1 hypothetical protein [Neolewinella marina]PHL00127.1 hypothetical protein CGL56_03535 [Neolewinella marina]
MLYRCLLLFLLFAAGARVPGQSVKPASPTMDEIRELPDTTLRLAFHFVALPDGTNFVRDARDSLVVAHGGHEKLRADVLMYYLLRELNHRFRVALLDYPPSRDTKLRFALVGGADRPLESAAFYREGEPLRPVAEGFNIVFTRYRGRGRPDAATTGTGSTTIYVYDRLQTYLAGSHDTWTVARLIGHELGHALSLDHTFKCDNPCAGRGFDPLEECYGECTDHNGGSGAVNCFGGSPRELMMGYGSQLHLTVCEVERMWAFLLR